MGFRKFPVYLCSPQRVTEIVPKVVAQRSENSKFVSSVIVKTEVDVCSDEYVKDIPTPEEYSLENLLTSGVPLSVIPTKDMLNSTDVDEYNALASRVLPVDTPLDFETK